MRVLVTWGSKRGGTPGIGAMIADTLGACGCDVMAAPIERVTSLDSFDAFVIGGALYANLWPSKARRFINRHRAALRKVPVWMFSSGPLDMSADEKNIPPTRAVGILAQCVGAGRGLCRRPSERSARSRQRALGSVPDIPGRAACWRMGPVRSADAAAHEHAVTCRGPIGSSSPRVWTAGTCARRRTHPFFAERCARTGIAWRWTPSSFDEKASSLKRAGWTES